MPTLTPAEISYQQAHIHQNKGPVLIGVASMFIVLCTLAVIGRVYARVLLKAKFAADDYFTLLSWFFLVGLALEIIIIARNGVGKHAIALTANDAAVIGKAAFALEFTYCFLVLFVKLSILLLYRRIFTMLNKIFQIGWWILMCGSIAWFLLTLIIAFVQCRPLSSNWTTNPNDACDHPYSLAILSGILNVINDFFILLLPAPVIWNLQVPAKQRFAVLGIFALGSLVIVVSCIKLPSLKGANTATDPTYDRVNGFIWTFVEPGVALICACLPTMTPLFRRLSASTRSMLSRRTQSTHNAWSANALTPNSRGRQWSTIKGGDVDERPMNKTLDGNGITVHRDLEYSSYAMSDLSQANPKIETVVV